MSGKNPPRDSVCPDSSHCVRISSTSPPVIKVAAAWQTSWTMTMKMRKGFIITVSHSITATAALRK